MKGSLFFVGLLLVLVCVLVVSSYSPGSVAQVGFLLQSDNGTGFVNVTANGSCNGSVFFMVNNSLVVNDTVLNNSGGFFYLNFTPCCDGSYVFSSTCLVGDERVSSYTSLAVSSPSGTPSGSGGSGASPLFNGVLTVDNDYFEINTRDDAVLNFSVGYSNFGLPALGNNDYRILRGRDELAYGTLVLVRTGEYAFSYDFGNLPSGDYDILLEFPGASKIVKVKLVSYPGFLSFLFKGRDQQSMIWLILIVFFVFLFLFVSVVYAITRKRKRMRQAQNAGYR